MFHRIARLVRAFFYAPKPAPMPEPDQPAKTSEQGIALIQHFEGLRLKAYLCPGNVWTIGYGHTQGVRQGDRITPAEANRLLRMDLDEYEEDVNYMVNAPLNQQQFDALVSFTFNLGGGNLKRSTLLIKLNALDYDGAADEFPRWKKSGGRILPGLITRRAAERALFLGQDWRTEI